jgi:hypothetical protein
LSHCPLLLEGKKKEKSVVLVCSFP